MTPNENYSMYCMQFVNICIISWLLSLFKFKALFLAIHYRKCVAFFKCFINFLYITLILDLVIWL